MSLSVSKPIQGANVYFCTSETNLEFVKFVHVRRTPKPRQQWDVGLFIDVLSMSLPSKYFCPFPICVGVYGLPGSTAKWLKPKRGAGFGFPRTPANAANTRFSRTKQHMNPSNTTSRSWIVHWPNIEPTVIRYQEPVTLLRVLNEHVAAIGAEPLDSTR